MKRFWGPFIIAVVVLVASFFIISLSMASYHNHSIVDEWHSWLPAQEQVVETEDNNEEVVLEEEDYEVVS